MKRPNKGSWIASGLLVLVTAVIMAYLFWPRPISLSTTRTGDADLLTQIGEPAGYRNLHVTVVDLDSASPIRRANIGATETTLFETGSLTKALTGLALADSIRRGEVTLDDPVAKHLDFGDAPAGQVTLRELATHHAGYPSLGGRTFWTGLTTMVTAGNPYRAGPGEVLAEAREVKLKDRGQYEYSNLGAAVTGQALAAAAGLTYRDYLQRRILAPLGMTSSQIAAEPLVAGGLTERGRASAPWVMDGYAPAGGTVSTGADLTRLASAILERKAPGLAALRPFSEGSRPDRKIGMFWQQSPIGPDERMITWHNGRTGGYASFLGFDLAERRAIIVLADVSKNVDALALRLLNQPS